MARILSIAIALIVSHANAQTVRVTSHLGDGTGVVVAITENLEHGRLGYVLTAHHVVPDGAHCTILFENGEDCENARVMRRNVEYDIALVWTWIPYDIPVIAIGDVPKRGTIVRLHGTGGRIVHGPVALVDRENIYADLIGLQGDSGGPILVDGKLVGICSGGWFWLEHLDVTYRVKPTWPLRAAGPGPIARLLKGD